MKHFGDITKINGYEAPIVDCIIGGSPCQDLSVAGLREGLKGQRSGLYMEQIRIVKEMRDNDKRNGRTGVDVRPRFMVWENVPGAFSSNKGEDFRIVLEELAKITNENASIPMPQKSKWTTSGCIVGDGWSIAWRVFDAQFWGVPQRRRRIALVADFGGQSAPEILFVRQSLYGNIEQSKPKRQNTSTDASNGIGTDDRDKPYTMIVRNGCEGGGKGALVQTDISATLNTTRDQTLFQPVYSVENHPADSRVEIDESGKVQTLTTRMGTGGGNVPMVMETYSKTHRASSKDDNETWKESGVANTLNTFDQGDTRATDVVVALDRASYNQGKNAKFDIGIDENGVAHSLVAKGPSAVCYSVDQGGGKSACNVQEGQAPTLTCTHGGEPAVCYGFDPNATRDVGQYFLEDMGNTVVNGSCPGHHNGVCIAFESINGDKAGTLDSSYYKGCGERQGVEREVVAAVDCRNCTENSDINGTLQCHSKGGTSLNLNNVVRTNYIVRRLTPLECERLQGYPDGWTDIGDWTDSKGKVHKTSDSARYKALGNSIALPPWKWVLKRLCACYERDATMASLFDGIGGFPYLWEQLNGKGTCLWASEIEEFPMAVTKKRIGGD